MKILLFSLLITASCRLYASTTICQIGSHGMMGLSHYKPQVISWSTDTKSAKIKLNDKTYSGHVILVRKFRDDIKESDKYRFSAKNDVESGGSNASSAGKKQDRADEKKYYSVVTIDFNIAVLGMFSGKSDDSEFVVVPDTTLDEYQITGVSYERQSNGNKVITGSYGTYDADCSTL